ncbi:hypothetical protein HW932_10390 [Allochromatium humboldtianum]|uniref:Uncharacterized protein n=1 Tax=Allochromatium humboldtianum TaxID=504901 RepID=A0A850RFE9_9GAMM|nr:hypothetical protein [Allochromatium humboldtianum]NVZ09670.1 hypothetical protein [Allochromatium humboldtianum]
MLVRVYVLVPACEPLRLKASVSTLAEFSALALCSLRLGFVAVHASLRDSLADAFAGAMIFAA